MNWKERIQILINEQSTKFSKIFPVCSPMVGARGISSSSETTKHCLVVLQKAEQEITLRPTIQQLGIYPDELKTGTQISTHTHFCNSTIYNSQKVDRDQMSINS